MKDKIINHIRYTKWLNEDIVFSDIGKFIYLKPSRTAGTSIFRGVLEKNEDLQVKLLRDNNPYRDLFNPNAFHKARIHSFELMQKDSSFNKVPEWVENLTDDDIKHNYFVFTFVRNPFEKIVSCYRYLGELVGATSFENFLEDKLLDDDGYFTNGHWLPYHYYVECDGEIFTDFIGRFENLHHDWDFIQDKLSLSNSWNRVILPHLGETSWAQGNYSYREYYTDYTIDIVSDIYRRDLELFGYGF